MCFLMSIIIVVYLLNFTAYIIFTEHTIYKMSKISIRFFNDREVRAIWDETNSKWWFSVLDIVGVLNTQDDYTKNRNYWKYLKNKLKNEGSEVVSVTNQLNMTADDGKRYQDENGVVFMNIYEFLLDRDSLKV